MAPAIGQELGEDRQHEHRADRRRDPPARRVCRISRPIPIENSPSTARYSPAPTTALVTPGSLSVTATLLLQQGSVPTK